MLEFLRIRNLALIEDAELEFSKGMNVLTGETGAGKSFILKALGFLLGDKLDSNMVRPGCDKAQVEGIFWQGDSELLLRRELVAETGRSRMYINDSLGSQDAIKALRTALLIHTSQHGQQKLLQPAWQAQRIDASIPDQNLLHERDKILKQLHEVEARITELNTKYQRLSEKRDLLEMQQQEIDAVAPQTHEEEELEAQKTAATQAARDAKQFENALNLLRGENDEGILDTLPKLQRILEGISITDQRFSDFSQEISQLSQSLQTLESVLRRPPQTIGDIDLDAIEARLYALAQLKRKLKRPLDDIIGMRATIAENLSFLDVCALDLRQLHKEQAVLLEALRTCMQALLPARRAAADIFCHQLQEHLRGLGFSEDVKVTISFSSYELWKDITDEKARILWAPNPGQVPQPLDKIASGGELSRFLLALISMQPAEESATFIFDEVDAGIGGITLNKVAERLQQLAKHRQMLLITHWPQLAVTAQRHFQISKVERDASTYTLCTQLSDKDRQQELARMAGGGVQGSLLAQSLLLPMDK